jgi:mono/diheme cytochrome c family protein
VPGRLPHHDGRVGPPGPPLSRRLSLPYYLGGALLIAGLTLADAGPRFQLYVLERDLQIALSVARLLVLVFLFFRLASDLAVPTRVLVALGSVMAALAVLGVLFLVPPQTVVLTPADQPLGEELFVEHCSRCHGPRGQGASASSLVDGRWTFGESFDEVSLNIAAGIPDSGMPAYASTLGTESIPFVAGYVFELQEVARQGAQPEQQD